MTSFDCGFFDIGCHLQSGLWSWWLGIGWFNQVLIACGLLAVALGVSWSFLQLLKRLGGWPAMAGGAAVVVGLVLALLPRGPRAKRQTPLDDDPDFAPPPAKPKRPVKPIPPVENRPGTWNSREGRWN